MDSMLNLTTLVLLPLAGALLVGLTPKGAAQLQRLITLAVSVAVGVVGTILYLKFDGSSAKAQFLQERAKLKTYVYELRSHVPTLIHASEHMLSAPRCEPPPGSLGLNKVYSSDLEREMFFQCFVMCE